MSVIKKKEKRDKAGPSSLQFGNSQKRKEKKKAGNRGPRSFQLSRQDGRGKGGGRGIQYDESRDGDLE